MNHQKLCRKCAFPQNFRTWKLVEITVFYTVYINETIQEILKLVDKVYQQTHAERRIKSTGINMHEHLIIKNRGVVRTTEWSVYKLLSLAKYFSLLYCIKCFPKKYFSSIINCDTWSIIFFWISKNWSRMTCGNLIVYYLENRTISHWIIVLLRTITPTIIALWKIGPQNNSPRITVPQKIASSIIPSSLDN